MRDRFRAEGMAILAKGAQTSEIMLDKTGDALKEFMIRSTDYSTTSMDAYKALGLNGDEMSRKLLAGGDAGKEAFKTVVSALDGVQDEAKKSQIALSLFGTPLEDLGTGNIGNFVKGLKESNSLLGETAGKADEIQKVFGDTMEGSLTKVKNSLQSALGDIALPLLQSLLPYVQQLASWLSENKELVVQWGGPLLIIGGIVTSLIAIFSALGPVFMMLTGVTFAFNAALFASPLFIWSVVIMAVIIAIMLLATHWEEVTNFIVDSINWVGEALKNLGNMFSDIFSGIGKFFGFGDSSINISSTSSGVGVLSGAPKMAKGGLIKGDPTGVGYPAFLGDGKKNEIVMNEDVYNKREEKTYNVLDELSKNGTSGGVVQKNYFTQANPREVKAVMDGGLKQMIGFV
jgi:hypothetical protein